MTTSTSKTPASIKQGPFDGTKALGTAEVCEILGVASGNLFKLAGLPEPAQTLTRGFLWREDEIKAFAKKRANRRNGK